MELLPGEHNVLLIQKDVYYFPLYKGTSKGIHKKAKGGKVFDRYKGYNDIANLLDIPSSTCLIPFIL
jgi:hypothetical protein